MAELNTIYNRGNYNHVLGNYIYHAASETADTIGDARESYSSNTYLKERCTVANATKGAGTWKKILSKRYTSLTDSNELEPAGSYLDLTSAIIGKCHLVFSDGTDIWEALFRIKADGSVAIISADDNVFTSLQTGTNHVYLKDNGTNVRIVNEMGTTITINTETKIVN